MDDPQTSKSARRWPRTTNSLNYVSIDPNLHAFLRREAPDLLGPEADLESFGAWVAGPLNKQADYSTRYAPPVLEDGLETPGVPGARRNRVVFNPAYLQSQSELSAQGIIADAYSGKFSRAHMPSFVKGGLTSQADISSHCPGGALTGSVAHNLFHYAPAPLREKYLPEITRTDGKALTGGTWYTEKDSGTDLANTKCIARKADDGSYQLYGEKYFASNAASGLALVMARPEGAPDGVKGVALYLVPSHIGGESNSYNVTSLKNKLGTSGLATAEIDLNGCIAYEIAPPGRGVQIGMEALVYSRVHNAMAGWGVAQRCYVEALCWSENRDIAKRPLIDRPMTEKILINLATEASACLCLAGYAAQTYADLDAGLNTQPGDQSWMRITTAAAKYRTARVGVQSATKLIELTGGSGYTTDFPAQRILRDAVALMVWEGPEQVQALEVQKVILNVDKEQDTLNTRLQDICDALPDSMGFVRRSLSRELNGLKSNIRELKERAGKPDGMKVVEQVADDLLVKIADIMTYALMARDAAWRLEHDNDQIPLMLTEHFYTQNFGERYPIRFDASPLQDNFNTLVNPRTLSFSASAISEAATPGERKIRMG